MLGNGNRAARRLQPGDGAAAARRRRSDGGCGIRTHEPSRAGRFQDDCLQPLGQPPRCRLPTPAAAKVGGAGRPTQADALGHAARRGTAVAVAVGYIASSAVGMKANSGASASVRHQPRAGRMATANGTSGLATWAYEVQKARSRGMKAA